MRELSDESVAHQVEQLLEYVRRGGVISRWLDSKAFMAADRAAILKGFFAAKATA